MQTPAERYLIEKVAGRFRQGDGLTQTRVLNVGAGRSAVIEMSLREKCGDSFICDRVDIVECHVDHPSIGKCFVAPVESMSQIHSGSYQVAFANYVFEHVDDLNKAASEVARVLAPSGHFVTSLPNPLAPEFILSKYTPTAFHQFIKGEGEGHHAHQTRYAYKSISDFTATFEQHFRTVEIRYWANTYGYLYRFPIINFISKVYDYMVNLLQIKLLMGNVCIVFQRL